MTDLEYRIAVHEAGHAAASIEGGVRFKTASVVGDAFTLGRVDHGDKWFGLLRPDVEVTPRVKTRLEAMMVSLLAGYWAEVVLTGAEDGEGCQYDFDFAWRLGSYVTDGDIEETNAYVEWLNQRSRRLMNRPHMKAVTDAIAGELIERKQLKFSDALEARQAGIDRYIRESAAKQKARREGAGHD